MINHDDDRAIINMMAEAFGDYYRAHPEIGIIKVRCMTADEGLLWDLVP